MPNGILMLRQIVSMGSIRALFGKLKPPLSKAMIAIVVLCLALGFVFDSVYSKAPKSPDPNVGRTIPHAIKWHGEVFLTAEEDAPYRWIIIVAGSAITVLIVLTVVGFAIARQSNPPE